MQCYTTIIFFGEIFQLYSMSHIITTSTQASPLEVTDLCTHHSNLCCGPGIVDVTTKVFRAHHIICTTIRLAERQNFI